MLLRSLCSSSHRNSPSKFSSPLPIRASLRHLRARLQLPVPNPDFRTSVLRRNFHEVGRHALEEDEKRTITTCRVASEAIKAYDAGQIQVLEGLEAVRKSPRMYIGSTGPKGLHHLVYEVLDTQSMRHKQDLLLQWIVILLTDGSVSISDDGHGIPTDVHPVTGKSALETVLMVLHAGGKFGGDNSGYGVSGGLHGVGISVVNAVSEMVNVTVWRNEHEYKQSFEFG